MTRVRTAVRLELRLQRRYGFLYAAAFSGLLWIAVLLAITPELRDVAAPFVLFGDMMVVGFFFIAGSLFFEKTDRTVFAQVVTPLRFAEYLGAKVAALTALSTALAFAILVPVHGLAFDYGLTLVGVVLATVLLLLVSFVTAVPYASISDWIMPSGFYLLVLGLPVLHYSGLWEHPVLYAIPTQGALIFFGSAFGQLQPAPWEFAYAVIYQLLWIALLALLARRVFDRYVVAGEGKS
jgi:fluoroquinolone transport system permease protein